jgi:hypothetical protein
MKNMHAHHPLLALVIGIFAAGCSAEAPNAADLETKADPITGGELAFSPYSSVVRFNTHCVATKIADFRFLTSAGCLSSLVTSANPSPTMFLTNAANGLSNKVMVRVVNSYIHPSVVNTGLYPNTDPTVAFHSNYDAGIFEVDRATTFPVSPINSIPFDDFFGGNLLGYGCDTVHPDHNSKKQTASISARSFAQIRDVYDTATHSTDFLLDHYRHYVSFGVPGGVSLCDGDWGGPTFRNTNNAIAAINSSYDGVLSHITRTANIKRWLENPTKNFLDGIPAAFLLNAQTAKCVTSQSGLVNAAICSAPAQDTDVQNWIFKNKPVSGQAQGWTLENGNTGLCLTRLANGQLGTASCDNSDAQSWTFQFAESYPPFSVPGQREVITRPHLTSAFSPNLCRVSRSSSWPRATMTRQLNVGLSRVKPSVR